MRELLAKSQCQTLKINRTNYQSRAELCLCLATLAELQPHSVEFLHAEELAYYSTLVFAKRQHSYLLGRYCAKQAIGRYNTEVIYSDILIKPGVFDYPIIYHPSNKKLQLTLSHCANLGVALVFPETHPMGIDLENIEPSHQAIIDTQLTDNEKDLISTYPYINDIVSPNLTITTYAITNVLHTIFWTLKEALSKVLRTGMMTPLAIYAVKNITFQDHFWLSEFENFAQYQGRSFLLGRQICSIVYPKQTKLSINYSIIYAWLLQQHYH
jgi:4'-phosphopantetheinyl transferase